MTFTIDDVPLDTRNIIAMAMSSCLTLIFVLSLCICAKIFHKCRTRRKPRRKSVRRINRSLLDVALEEEGTEFSIDGEMEDVEMGEFVGSNEEVTKGGIRASTKEDPYAEG